MSQAYGQLATLHFNDQGSFGQIFTGSLEAVPVMTDDLAESIEQLVDEGIFGRHAPGPSFEGPRASAGSIRMQPLPDPLGHFLRGAAGQVTSVLVESAGKHVFTLLQTSDYEDKAAVPPMTIVSYKGVTSAEAFGDMCVNELTLEIAHSQLLVMNVGLIGGQRAFVAKTAPVYPEGTPWRWHQGSLSFGGVGVEELRSLTINHNNNLEQVYTVANSTTPQRIKRTGFPEVTGTATVLLTAATHSYFMSLFQAQSENQVLMNFNGATSPGNLLIDIPQARITQYAPAVAGAGQVEVDIQFMAKWDSTSSYLAEYILTNCRVSYP